MKNTLKINHTDMTLVMDRTFAKLASDTRSDEYAHLQKIRADYPTYTVVERHIKRNVQKKTYAGLTYTYMEMYIKTHGTKEKQEQNLAELSEMRLIASCHSKRFRYPVIKSWFLEQYPEIANFGLEDEDTDNDNNEVAPVTEVTPIAKAC